MRFREIAVALILITSFPLRAAVSGRVSDADGQPLTGIRVDAFRAETWDEFAARVVSEQPEAKPLATVRTADDGSFSIAAEGERRLVLAVDGRFVRGALDGESVDIILPDSRTIPIRVMAGRAPAAGALVITGNVLSFRADAKGKIHLPAHLADLRAPIVVYRGYGVQSITSTRVGRVDVRLRAADAVRGRVMAADGKTPVAGAVVSVDGWPLGRSAEDGSFQIATPPHGWRQLSARAGSLAGFAGRKGSEPIAITLRPASRIAGTIRTKDRGVADGARVTFTTASVPQQQWVFTDSKGRYSYDGLAPGTWQVMPVFPGYRFTSSGAVRVSAGADVEKSFVLEPSIRVQGTVLDESQKPLPGVLVTSGHETARTSAEGTFTIAVVSPVLQLRRPGFAAITHGPLDLDAPPAKPLRFTMERGVELRVRLVNASGDAVAGEQVMIAKSGARQIGGSPCFGNCFTDGSGSFIVRVAKDKYDIRAGGSSVPVVASTREVDRDLTVVLEAPESATVTGIVRTTDGSPLPERVMVIVRSLAPGSAAMPVAPDGSFELTSVPVGRIVLRTIREGGDGQMMDGPEVTVTAPAKDVVIEIPPTALVTGHAIDRGTRQPVKDFHLNVRRPTQGGGYSVRGGSPVYSEDGSFAVDTAGTAVDITVVASGYAPGTAVGVKPDSEPILIELEPGGSIRGQVTGPDGPVADATVMLRTEGRQVFSLPAPVRTDANGEFIADSLATGTYLVTVAKRGLVSARKTVEVERQTAAVTIEMSAGGSVSGRVIDERGAPVEGARIVPRMAMNRGMRSHLILSDADGAFQLEGLEEGPLTIAAEKDGYVTGLAENVDPSRTNRIAITLTRGGSVSGRITGLAPGEMGNVSISASWPDGHSSRAEPASDGTFTLTGLRDGSVTLYAHERLPAGRRATASVEVRNGSAPFVEIPFAAGHEITGRVIRQGSPVAGATVIFHTSGRRASAAEARTSHDGSYAAQVEQGPHDVTIRFGAGAFPAGSITVTGPARHDFEISGGAITGRVVDDGTGSGVSSAAVFLRPVGNAVRRPGTVGSAGTATTDSEGRFTIDVAAPGRYEATVSKPPFATAAKQIEVVDGATAEVELRLREGTAAIVQVLDRQTRRPIEGAAITVYDASKKIVSSGLPLPVGDGGLRIWLQPGTYSARIWHSEYAPVTVALVVPGPDAFALLDRAGRIVVQGTPAGAVQIRLNDPATGKIVQRGGLPPGVLQQLPPGMYRLEAADRAGKVLAARDVVVHAGQTTTVALD